MGERKCNRHDDYDCAICDGRVRASEVSYAQGRADERAAVVAWLRKRTRDAEAAAYERATPEAGAFGQGLRDHNLVLADIIERGEHVEAAKRKS